VFFRQLSVVYVMVIFLAAASLAAPLKTVDLASDSDWTLVIDRDASAKRSIKVPNGGWNSDQQEPQIPSALVEDHMTCERKIVVPNVVKGNVVKVKFNAED
jgi:hypothetical protein